MLSPGFTCVLARCQSSGRWRLGSQLCAALRKENTRTGKDADRVIDLWLKDQPAYYAQLSGGGYDKGKEMAATKADYITYEMEHGPLDFKDLREFMRRLVEAGPTEAAERAAAVRLDHAVRDGRHGSRVRVSVRGHG